MDTSLGNAVGSAAGAQPDYIAIAMVAVMALIVIVMVIRKHLSLKKSAQDIILENTSEAEKAVCVPAAAPGTAGELKMHDVEPRTAAMLMAIVADTIGAPLNELRFISVKEIK